MQAQQSAESKKKKLILVLFLCTGVISTFAYKLQGSQLVDEGSHINKKFFHPYMQSLTMFIGESLCLLAYLSQGNKIKLQLQQGKKPHKWYIFAIPACSDGISSMLQYMALFFISGSTYMMFKGTSIVTTALFSKLLFNMVIEKRHLAGCGLAILGLAIVGLAGLLDNSGSGDQTDFKQQLLGYGLMLVSLVFNGFLYAYEQKLLKKHTIHPLQMVGSEGCFGIIFILIVVTILSFIPCHFGISGCVFNSDDNSFMQLPLVFLKQVASSAILLTLVITGILTLSLFNFGGVSITKLFDALTRSLLNVTKTTFIWIFGIIITVFATTPQYKLQSLNVGVNLVKAVGFCSIILGTLIYNKLLFQKYFADKGTSKQSLLEDPQNLQNGDSTNSINNK